MRRCRFHPDEVEADGRAIVRMPVRRRRMPDDQKPYQQDMPENDPCCHGDPAHAPAAPCAMDVRSAPFEQATERGGKVRRYQRDFKTEFHANRYAPKPVPDARARGLK